MTKTDVHPDDAAFLVVGIDCGVWTRALVQRWADGEIERKDSVPPMWLIECSLCSHTLDARRALLPVASVAGLDDDYQAELILLAYAVATELRSPRVATGEAYSYVMDLDHSLPFVGDLYWLADAFSLAEEGVSGTQEEAEQDARRFFLDVLGTSRLSPRFQAFLSRASVPQIPPQVHS